MDLTKISAAKLWLISSAPSPTKTRARESPKDLPYLATALYALIPVPSPEVKRMTVDESWRLYINPVWLTEATVPEVGQDLAHLVWHLLCDHASRARDMRVDVQTSTHWEQGTDATIAETLAADLLTPQGCSSASELGLPPGLSAEEYYAILSRLPPSEGGSTGTMSPHEGCGSGADGLPRSHELPPDADAGVDRHDAQEIRRTVAIDYSEHAGRRGDTPGEAWRWTQTILEPKIAWEPLLAQSVRRAVGWAAGRGDYTYSRPSRRASSVRGIVLPGMRRPVPRVSMIIDTSASVDDGLLGRALGEVDGALLSLGVAGSDVSVYSCDAAVHTVQRVRRARDARLGGGGGTDLRAGFVAVDRQRPRPDVVVVLTDGDTPWPHQPPPSCAVIIALLGRHRSDLPPTPAWAVRVECLLD
ncbi:DUF2201 family putative metallopeptidase [Nocardioides zhouii]|nr:VWA-like domain-containing protein [Nocardioides zhouii]